MAASIFRPGLLEGRVAVVTGGGSGIGAAVTRQLAALGCQVVIASRSTERLAAAVRGFDARPESKGRVHAMQCNIRRSDEVAALMDAVVHGGAAAERERRSDAVADAAALAPLPALGRLDFLVNNGGGQFPSPAAQIRDKGWAAVLETNLTGAFYCSREAFRAWQGDHGGAIVNIVADMWKGFPGMSHTGAARAGVVNLTKSLAVEWAAAGVRVNALAPGIVYSQTAADNYDDKTMLTGMAPRIPAKRLGTVDEVAAAVVFLLSPASAYTTGATLNVDGGSSLATTMWPLADHGNSEPYGDLPDECRAKY